MNHEITESNGVQQQVEVDGIAMEPIANSEESRINYIPNATLNGKIITIPIINSSVKVVGCTVEKCTLYRNLQFTTNDLAYTCDIEALNKKIDNLAEQSHSNDVAMLSIQDTYTTVDEVNEVLKEYVLKSDYEEMKAKLFYSDYIKPTDEEYIVINDVSGYTYDSENKELIIYSETIYNTLFIIRDTKGKKHYVEFSRLESTINGEFDEHSYKASFIVNFTIDGNTIDYTVFEEIYVNISQRIDLHFKITVLETENANLKELQLFRKLIFFFRK